MPCAAIWTIVVAHARPLVGPGRVTTVTKVVIVEPSHWCRRFSILILNRFRLRTASDKIREIQIPSIRYLAGPGVVAGFSVLRVGYSDKCA